ncbi:transcriptional regulator [Rhizobium sp. P32RR-XVIII]|nr:transcriptional regulator [Rhizobium sp. P32RR-XVIII]
MADRPANRYEGLDFMKKPQRNFVVEFKSSSRRQSPKPTSIWGNVDLKAISLEVEADAPGQVLQATERNANSPPPGPQTRERLLTKTVEQPKTVLPPQEERMAEETTPVLSADNSSIETATTITEPKKRRGRQAKTVGPQMAAGDETSAVPGDAKTTPAKPAKKPRIAKSVAAAEAKVATKQPRKTRMRKAATAAVNTPAADDMADLLQLEEENRNLRKQLAEKLRSENADLRKRLGQS